MEEEPWDIFLTDKDTINIKIKEHFRTFKNGKLIEEANPLKFPGSRMQKIGKNWYAHAWHGTIKRLDEWHQIQALFLEVLLAHLLVTLKVTMKSIKALPWPA